MYLLSAAGLTFVLAKVSKTICGAELGIHASNKLHHVIPIIPFGGNKHFFLSFTC
jgi:hypothetical protein